ncbi:MAG: 2-(1,2-epoxy-1,2-dihydrophenyl)acetyl-CoA isomerase [Acidimicrobiales bacterium]|jgi:2-(1,2-epoxy-1,2-dihydrophenyl)acetyl-CoA isomerase
MVDMPNGTVTCEIVDDVATVTLSRPESLNSMTDDLMRDISSAVAMAEEGARVMVLTGAGRAFCSGADLSGVGQSGDGDFESNPDSVTSGMDDFFNPALRNVKNCAIPTVSRINGVAAGGGLGLALACDISIASRDAFFVATFGPRLGIVPDLGSTWSLPQRAGRARALGITMLGERFSADEAAEWGLIWKAVDADQLDVEVAKATATLSRSSAEAMRRIRSAIESSGERSFSEQLDVERDHQRVLIPKNMGEGAAAFLEKREPNFTQG